VTKKEIVKTISEECGLTQLKTKEVVQKTFDAIIEALITDGRIELRNFGVFEVKRRTARKARNPKTNDSVFVPEKNVVTFKPGKEMEQQVLDMDKKGAITPPASNDENAASQLSSHTNTPTTESPSESIARETSQTPPSGETPYSS